MRLGRRPFFFDRGVELGAHHDGEAEKEREQQERDRCCQRSVGVAGAGDVLQVDPQSGGCHHEDGGCQHRAPHQSVGRQGSGQRNAVEDRHHDHQTDGQHRVVTEAQDVVPTLRNVRSDRPWAEGEEGRSGDDAQQSDDVDPECEEPLPHRMPQRRLTVRLHDRINVGGDRRGSGPQADHEAQRHHLATCARGDVLDGRLNDLGDDVLRKETARRTDQLTLNGRQGVRSEQRGDVGQAAEQAQQQRRQRQDRPKPSLSRLRKDRVVPTFGQRSFEQMPHMVTRRGRGSVVGHRPGGGQSVTAPAMGSRSRPSDNSRSTVLPPHRPRA